MKIEINIPEEMCDTILKRHHYITETTTLYYNEFDDYVESAASMKPVQCVVAYPEGKRPDKLNDKFPLIEDCKNIMYDNVIEKLFNSWLIKIMLRNDPT